MLSLKDVLEAVNQLSPQEQQRVREYIETRQKQLQVVQRTPQEIAQRAAKLDGALERFWEGIPEAEVEGIIKAMNDEYIEPEDAELFRWADESARYRA